MALRMALANHVFLIFLLGRPDWSFGQFTLFLKKN